jgi:SAM-dependent methyltransferase
MPSTTVTQADLLTLLRDPETGAKLTRDGDGSLLVDGGPSRHPVVDGIPVVLPPGSAGVPPASGRAHGRPRIREAAVGFARRLSQLPPSVTRNVGSATNYRELAQLLRVRSDHTTVLVIGGATEGIGFEALRDAEHVQLVETDVVVGPRTSLICDAHALPFADATFDAIVCQGVLAVLCDPVQAVAEFHRVLAPGGLIYSEAAFLQGVCNGGLDFTRWTHAGHRRLLHEFEEIRSGAHNGPGMALAWQTTYFLMAFAGESRIAHAVLRRVASLLTFWLTWFDPWLVRRPGGLDGAAGTYFLGRRSERTVDDATIVADYRGAVHPPSDPRPA